MWSQTLTHKPKLNSSSQRWGQTSEYFFPRFFLTIFKVPPKVCSTYWEEFFLQTPNQGKMRRSLIHLLSL
ncbi:hypothetical protein AOY38_07240 [Synechocystis sp. PCC 6803]|nr:hypothetical protein AOY38_07240 [Synechocystis sp. PCC 6803]